MSNIWPGALESGLLVEQLLNDSGCCISDVSDQVSSSPASRSSTPACVPEGVGEGARGGPSLCI